jgi:hypothetical protein
VQKLRLAKIGCCGKRDRQGEVSSVSSLLLAVTQLKRNLGQRSFQSKFLLACNTFLLALVSLPELLTVHPKTSKSSLARNKKS